MSGGTRRSLPAATAGDGAGACGRRLALRAGLAARLGAAPLADAAAVIAAIAAIPADGLRLRYGDDRDFWPFESPDAQGRPQGFQIELLADLARVAGLALALELLDWPAVEAGLRVALPDALPMQATRSGALSGLAARFIDSPSPLAALQAVATGRADAAVLPRAYGDRLLAGGAAPGDNHGIDTRPHPPAQESLP